MIRFLILICFSLNSGSGLIFAHALYLCVLVSTYVVAAGFAKGGEKGKKAVCANGGMHAMFSYILRYYWFQKTLCSPSGTTILFAHL